LSQWGEFQGRIEDNRLITGQGLYVGDVAPERMTHSVVVRAQVASARVMSIDTDAALASPGVLAVYTGKDLAADGLPDFPCGVELKRPNGQKAHQARRPVLVRDRIRAVGEPVAFVVAETLEAAEAAAELVVVETQDMPTVATVTAARACAAPAVWDEAPDNVAFVWKKGSAGDAITGAAHVFRLSSHVSRVAALSLEPRGALGRVDEAVHYMEALRGFDDNAIAIAGVCEEVLLAAGRVEEAYRHYAIEATRGTSYLATYRALVRKYPLKQPGDLLTDLVATTPGDEGKWFATAKEVGLFDEAIRLANSSPCDPKTATRAARDFADGRPEFAVEAGLAALRWLVAAHGYEITGADVWAAYANTMKALRVEFSALGADAVAIGAARIARTSSP